MTAFFLNGYWLLFTCVFGVFVFLVFSIQVLYLFCFSILGLLYKEHIRSSSDRLNRFVIYIPAYKEDEVILDSASRALLLDYPKELFHIVVIADSLRMDTLSALRKMPLQLVEVSFEKSTKAKALNAAIAQTGSDFNYAIVFDADNVASSDYLHRMNDAFNDGYQVVQGQRTAKNHNTPMALLDAISEGINNHIFRKGHRVLGLSAAIIGSGMGLAFSLFREVMTKITAVGGFDKEMELLLLKNRVKIGYAASAVVYDEKVQRADVLEKQRKRWLSAQVNYLRKHVFSGLMALITQGKLDYFNKVFQMALIPRVMMLALLPFSFLISFVPGDAPSPVYWLIVWATGYVAIMLAVPGRFLNKRLVSALWKLPFGMYSMFKAMLQMKGANRSFIHTPHGQTEENKKTQTDESAM